MTDEGGRKTQQKHWDEAWSTPVRLSLPSRLNVGVLNLTRLLAEKVRPGQRYLEIGCAPGKLLVWVSAVLGAQASGLDYSDTGIQQTRQLVDALGLDIELLHADLFENTLGRESFDVVASFGLIEHFDDPQPVVQRHLDLVKPGGLALIAVPNYGGIYGRLQHRFDAKNLEIHNLSIMSSRALEALVDHSSVASVRAYPYGVLSPWIVSLHKKLPSIVAGALSYGLNGLALLQPATIPALAPLLVLEIRTKRSL